MMKKILLLFFLFSALGFNAKSQYSQIGIMGEFNEWTSDMFLSQDPTLLDRWTLLANFTKDMDKNKDGLVEVKFRADAAWTTNWGATEFPMGTGVQNGANIPVIIDTNAASTEYFVTFNSSTGAYNFISPFVVANRGYSIVVDGTLNEADWHLDNYVAKLLNGYFTLDPNTVKFGVAYDDSFLYVGLEVQDALPTLYEMGEIFIDGNNSNGAYDANDLHLRFNGPVVTIVKGPEDLDIDLMFQLISGGYAAELAIPLAALGITPDPGSQIGFDIIFGDGDSGTQVDYMMSWTGDNNNYESTVAFGTLEFADQTGMNERPAVNMIHVYPNPASDHIFIEVGGETAGEQINVLISDITGRIILNEDYQVTTAGNSLKVDASGFIPGLYMIRIMDGDGNKITRKLLVSGK